VILRVRPGLPSLRTPALRASVKDAIAEGRERSGFQLSRYSLKDAELRLIVQASDRRALSRGIQGLSIRIARALNRNLNRSGRVFADRYEASVGSSRK
jgi:putative transposase